MKRVSVFGYYWFGTCVRYLQDVPADAPVHKGGYIRDNLSRVFKYLDEFGLVVTQRAARELGSFRDELDDLPKDAKLSADQAARLRDLIAAVRKTLEAEIEGLEAFLATPKRYDTDKLMQNVAALFSPGVFSKLPEIARFDLDEAGKCIAFERPTAAAFHILRATEAVLRHFYLSLIRRSRINTLLWGPIIQDLRLHKKTQKYETLYQNLDNIRHSYRNPTQHPEMVYDIHEAQDLFALCTEAVNRMMKIVVQQT